MDLVLHGRSDHDSVRGIAPHRAGLSAGYASGTSRAPLLRGWMILNSHDRGCNRDYPLYRFINGVEVIPCAMTEAAMTPSTIGARGMTAPAGAFSKA